MYEKISEKFNQNGFERTPDQVRTRVFNMIAEYRRILKDPNPERMKKCIFFETLDKIYNAKHLSDVKSAIDDYEPSNPYSPSSTNSKPPDMMLDSDSEALMDGHDDNSTSMDANSMSNNNSNSASTANKSATTNNNNNDTTNSATSNNSGEGNHNNKTSATSDNIANSINDNTPSKRATPAGKEGSSGSQSAAKRIKTEISSPKAGTSQGEQQANSENSTGGDVGTTGGLSKQPSSSKNSSSNQLNGPTMSTANTSTTSANKQQSLLASSSSTPMSKLTPQGGSNSAASYINLNSTTKLPILRSQFLGHSNGNESVNMNGTQQTTARLPTTAAITGHQLYQAPVNTFDVTSSALLIDRMFAHLARESENMREWIALEKERIAVERTRRSQEAEREIRRERVLIDTLLKFQDSWISFVSRLDPRLIEGAAGQMPELKIPPRETSDSQHSQQSMTQTPPGCSSVSQQTVLLNTTSCSSNTSIASIATGTCGSSNSSTATPGSSLSSAPLVASGVPNLIAPSAPVAGGIPTSNVATTSTATTTTTTNPAVTDATTVPTKST